MKRTDPKWIAILAFLILLAFTGSVLADNSDIRRSYLAPVSNNAGDCTTIVNPGQSIQAAITNARNGHVICVRAGTYHEQLIFGIKKAGITVMAYPGDGRPILDGRKVIPTGKYQGLVQINADNVTVEGLEVRDSAARGVIIGQPTNGTVPLRNAVVRNLVVHGSYDSGININGNDQYHLVNILIENNVVYDNLRKNAGGKTGGSALSFVDVDNSIARGNTIYNNFGEGLVADRWTNYLTFEDNISFDNKNANIYLTATAYPLIQRNLVFCTNDLDWWRAAKDQPAPGIMMRDEDYEGSSTKPPASKGQVVINNIVVGCGVNFGVSTQFSGGGLNDALIANNTFVNARGGSGGGSLNVSFAGDANYKNSSFINNLILQPSDSSTPTAQILLSLGDPDMSTFTLANNLYSVLPFKNWPTSEPGRVVADPQLVNPVMPVKGSIPDANGYALQSNSPAINAGRAVARVTEDFFGQSRGGVLDIGADETGGGPPPTTGQIVVTVATTPDQSAQAFSFTASYVTAPFELTDGETHNSGQLAPGSYNVAMTSVNGWTTSAICSDGSTPDAINLAAGETVTCTFNNEEQITPVTRIIVRKTTIPAGETQVFQFTSNFAGTFGLAHGDRQVTDLAAGVYSVSESLPEGWTQAGATCNDGSSPDAIDVSEGETVTCTFVNQKQITGGGTLNAIVHLATNTAGTVGGVNFEMGDILTYDGYNDTWSLYFDASAVGITSPLNDFVLMSDGSILLAVGARTTLTGPSGSFKLQPWDIARFVPSDLGSNTAGDFELYFDGSDVGLTRAGEKIDALTIQPNGTLLISTYGTATVSVNGSNIRAQDEDLLAFKPTKLSNDTQGTWEIALDGTKVPGMRAEDVTSAWYDSATQDYYLTVTSNFSINGAGGTNQSILVLKQNGDASIFWNAGDAGLQGPITGLQITP